MFSVLFAAADPIVEEVEAKTPKIDVQFRNKVSSGASGQLRNRKNSKTKPHCRIRARS